VITKDPAPRTALNLSRIGECGALAAIRRLEAYVQPLETAQKEAGLVVVVVLLAERYGCDPAADLAQRDRVF